MKGVVLSENSSTINKKSSSQQKLNKTSNIYHTQYKQINLLKQAINIRDDQIAQLKMLIAKSKQQLHKTTVTTQSDYDPHEHSQIKFSNFPLSNTIDCYREQLTNMENKYSQSCNVISQLQAKLRLNLANSKNKEEELKNEILILKQDLKYMKEQNERSTDCLKIQLEHRLGERLKLSENKYKQQMQLLNEEIHALRLDNSEKNMEIVRLGEKIKKQRTSNESNIKFIENQNEELRRTIETMALSNKQEVRNREERLIAQFQVDLTELHKEQAGEIRVLCDRIRILKSLLEEKEVQLNQIWRTRKEQASTTFTSREKLRRNKEDLQLSSIDKYLKH